MVSWSWTEPECLFTTDSNNKLQLNNATASKLKAVNEPLIVIAIAGLYRTGKSFIMNEIAHKNDKHKRLKNGFAVTASSELVTNGIWVWLIDNPRHGKEKILLVDTHGLGDPETNDSEYDNHILCLCSLLSSILIFNHKGEIDVTAIEKLLFANKLRQCVNNYESLTSLPEFILLVRDAQFDEQITDRYMEDKMFTPSKGYPQAHNNLIGSFTDCFSKRKCFTLPLPAESKQLRSPELYDHLDSDFKKEFDCFYQYVMKNAKCKMINGYEAMNGPKFINLATYYVDEVMNNNEKWTLISLLILFITALIWFYTTSYDTGKCIVKKLYDGGARFCAVVQQGLRNLYYKIVNIQFRSLFDSSSSST